jgi:hypothetical protein
MVVLLANFWVFSPLRLSSAAVLVGGSWTDGFKISQIWIFLSMNCVLNWNLNLNLFGSLFENAKRDDSDERERKQAQKLQHGFTFVSLFRRKSLCETKPIFN